LLDTNSYVVGFNVICLLNSKVTYMDTILLFESIGSNTNDDAFVANIVWSNLGDRINPWCEKIITQSSILHKEFTPFGGFN
jgi:hypothetical protein